MREKREKSQIINIRNNRGDIANSKYITDSQYIKRIIREQYEQLYANNFSNLDEMD